MFLGMIITFLCHLDTIEAFAIFFLYNYLLYLDVRNDRDNESMDQTTMLFWERY